MARDNGALMSTSKLKHWKKFKQLNKYFHRNVSRLTQYIVPENVSVLEFGSLGGELLASLKNPKKVGVEEDLELIKYASKNSKRAKFIDPSKVTNKIGRFDYILLNHWLSTTLDVQMFIKTLTQLKNPETRVVVYSFNYMWKPVLDLARKLGLMMPWRVEPNWLSEADVQNLFYLEDYEKIRSGGYFLFPYEIPFISDFINKYVAHLPVINNFCLIRYFVFKSSARPKDFSVSIVIPARNEAGHMKGVLKKIPSFGKKTEVVFVEGGSTDDTYEVIKTEIANYKGPIKASLWKQKGKGKGDAVRLGFSKAKNDLLMILDADLTVPPSDLIKFYNSFAQGKGEMVMGSRLVYPMEQEAMRTLNYLGNKLFSLVFSFLLGQKIKDTLCGTKVISKEDYQKISANRKVFGEFDPFGDFDLIFGAARLNLKILEIPIRYKERVYGTTNISRFRHGLLLIRMVAVAATKLKFI